jgi:hypothetical protein
VENLAILWLIYHSDFDLSLNDVNGLAPVMGGQETVNLAGE